LELSPIDESFQIGFTEDRALTFFDASDSLVQVEFQTGLPWVIEKPEPTEI
jgi:hypothetical protein